MFRNVGFVGKAFTPFAIQVRKGTFKWVKNKFKWEHAVNDIQVRNRTFKWEKTEIQVRVFIPCSKPLRFFFILNNYSSKSCRPKSQFLPKQKLSLHLWAEMKVFSKFSKILNRSEIQFVFRDVRIYQTRNNSWKMQNMGTVRTFIPTFLPGKRKKSTAETFFRNVTWYFINSFI